MYIEFNTAPLITPGSQAKLNFFESAALKVLPSLLPSFALPKFIGIFDLIIDGKYLSRDLEVGKTYALDPFNHCYASLLTGM